MGLIEKLQAKIELYRLEQRYARRKHRITFTTNAQYVDGEYVYPNNTGSTGLSPTTSTATVSRYSIGGSAWRPPGGWGGFTPSDRPGR